MKSLFEFKDYKKYLLDYFDTRGQRGERNRLANTIKCHNGYISQVLNGHADFSLEQAEKINTFLGHTKEESDYFLLLIQFGRAGTETLKNHFEIQMNNIIASRSILKNRLKVKNTISKEDQIVFYSSWHYSAVHVLVSVPGCHTEKGIAKYLDISLEKVRNILNFLVSIQLITLKNGKYEIGTSHIHLGNDSSMISRHHLNWRLKAMQSLDNKGTTNLNYSSVITVSKDDVVKIRELLINTIESIRKIVTPSPSETCFAYNIDLFGLEKDI